MAPPPEPEPKNGRWHQLLNFVALYDSPKCDATLGDATRAYVLAAGCRHRVPDSILDRPHVYFSNYVAGWLGLFQSPQVVSEYAPRLSRNTDSI